MLKTSNLFFGDRASSSVAASMASHKSLTTMLLLIVFTLIAILFSFFCSILEAVLLSVTAPYIVLMEKKKRPSGTILRGLKKEVGRPLAAILTLNTIAHTVGAAGVGAQAAVVFGSGHIGIVSAVLTFLILIFSEIIPKTLGAHYWRYLAPMTAYSLKYLVIVLYPFVKLSEFLTNRFTNKPMLSGFSREEISIIADISSQQGRLGTQETKLIKNLLRLSKTQIKDAMTPRVVTFCLAEDMLVEAFFHKHDQIPFSRVPIYKGEREDVTGYVVKSDLLLAQARGNGNNPLVNYRRDLPAILDTMSLQKALNQLLQSRSNMLLVVNEMGSIQGIVTLEDVLETTLGLEFIDEKDKTVDMQKEAKRIWRKRAKAQGFEMKE